MSAERISRYRVNEPQVAAEEIQGEVVVVSFETGRYYSMRDTAAEIWRLLAQGSSSAEVIAAYGKSGQADRSHAIEEFVNNLVAEELLVATSDAPVDLNVIHNGTYADPVLERFDDMQAMLLYDPIHDVDETGWPTLPESPKPQ